jgi:hypothetical protein
MAHSIRAVLGSVGVTRVQDEIADIQDNGPHVDYQRPLFGETPDLPLPAYMLVVSVGLVRIAPESGPIEVAPGTHRWYADDSREINHIPSAVWESMTPDQRQVMRFPVERDD